MAVVLPSRTVVLGVVLLGWWLLSCLHQLRGGMWTRFCWGWVPSDLLPRWSFFAPQPGSRDYRLMTRSKAHEQWSTWAPLHLPYRSPATRMLLHPEQHPHKCLSDLAQMLLREPGGAGSSTVLLHPAYLALLGMVSTQAHRGHASEAQFAIISTAGRDALRVWTILVLSEQHRCSGEWEHADAS